MPTTDFWRNLEAQFRELLSIPGSARFAAMHDRGKWSLTDGPHDERERARLHQLFLPLARAGAIAAGTPNGADTLDGWLNLLRAESPDLHVIYGRHKENGIDVQGEGGWIKNLVLASADYCKVRAARAFESETAATVAGVKEAIQKANQQDDVTAKATSGVTPDAAQPKPNDWEEIQLSFVGDHDVEVRIADGQTRKLNYKEISGFEDRRSGKPSSLWAMLRVFARLPDGTMLDDARNGKEWEAIRKKIERTSHALRTHFGLTGDPLPYIPGTGYRARIKFSRLADNSR